MFLCSGLTQLELQIAIILGRLNWKGNERKIFSFKQLDNWSKYSSINVAAKYMYENLCIYTVYS